MGQEEILFQKVKWSILKQNRQEQLFNEISTLDETRLLNTSVNDLCDYFEQKFRIDVPVLQEDNMEINNHEVDIDVSRDFTRAIIDRSRPYYIKGTEVEIYVPFEGNEEAFGIIPNFWSSDPPRAEVRGQEIIIRIRGTNLSADSVKQRIDEIISNIKNYLSHLERDVDVWNDGIYGLAKTQIDKRKEKILKDKHLVSSLGFSLRKREDNNSTYIVPEVRRKIIPKFPEASNQPYKPEPTLALDDYKYILDVIGNMANVMERSPSAFKNMNEEALRTHFLVQLNGHYEGQATGETFNYEGKTDILIRSNGKNLFIGECKFWKGKKALLDTIDQIQGYSSWRDTKVGILIFNRGKELSKVLAEIQKNVPEHNNCKKTFPPISETHFRYIFAHKDDRNREMTLSILVFDVPN